MLNNKYSASLGKLTGPTGPMASGLLKMHGQERGRGLSSSCFSLVSFCMTTVRLTSVKPNLKMQNHKCPTICGPYCALFGPLDYKVIACLSDKRCSTCTCSLSPSLSLQPDWRVARRTPTQSTFATAFRKLSVTERPAQAARYAGRSATTHTTMPPHTSSAIPRAFLWLFRRVRPTGGSFKSKGDSPRR
jgi:hypothetical protein